jgi:hypothetical protein
VLSIKPLLFSQFSINILSFTIQPKVSSYNHGKYRKKKSPPTNDGYSFFTTDILEIFSSYYFRKDTLMLIVDFGILLIGAEGAKTPAGVAVSGDPAGGTTRRLPERPRKAKRLERQ